MIDHGMNNLIEPTGSFSEWWSNYFIPFHRPNFFALCNPDWDERDCGNMTHPKFVTNYTCQGAENNVHSLFGEAAPWESKTVHMSFVSGHSSMAWQSAMFCVLYIQSQMRSWNATPHQILFIPLAQLLIIILAYFTSLTRVKDYWHHPGDVIGKYTIHISSLIDFWYY